MGKRENEVETYLDDQVKLRGGATRKFVSPGHAGVADRLLFMPGGQLWIVEVKTWDGHESGPQSRERKRMLKLGFRAHIVYGKEDVDLLMEEIDDELRSDVQD